MADGASGRRCENAAEGAEIHKTRSGNHHETAEKDSCRPQPAQNRGTYAQKDAPPETITAMYEYTDADGAPLLRVYRTDKKSFPTIHCDGGKWFWGDGGRHNVLYHLPEVVKAVQDGKKC